MNKFDIRTYQDACDYELEQGVVHVDGVPTPLRDLPEWAAAVRLAKREEEDTIAEFGGRTGEPDELIAMVQQDVAFNVLRVRFLNENRGRYYN